MYEVSAPELPKSLVTSSSSGSAVSGRHPETEILVLIDGLRHSREVLLEGSELAAALGVRWAAVYVETPGSSAVSTGTAAEAIADAAALGATVNVVPAATVLDGVISMLRDAGRSILVVCYPANKRSSWTGSLMHRLAAEQLDARVYFVADLARPPSRRLIRPKKISWSELAFAAFTVALTTITAAALRHLLGIQALGLLYLFPVVTAAARYGLVASLAATVLSILTYNIFFIDPIFGADVLAPQSWLMTIVLFPVSAYTSMLSDQLRKRVELSERSAKQSAGLAALVVELTRVATWTETAHVICAHVSTMFDVQTALFRQMLGELRIEDALPPTPTFTPLDQIALEYCWSTGEETGSGTAAASSADWRFAPLKTSLGTLAVLAIARVDGRHPLRADQQLLFATLIAQAALALERLELEERLRRRASEPNGGSGRPNGAVPDPI